MPDEKGTEPKLTNWGKLTALSTAIAAILIPVVIAIVGQQYTASIKEREIQGKFVELAIEILRQPPVPAAKALRRWAGDVINRYSGVPLGPELSADLIERLPLPTSEVQSQVLRDMVVKPLQYENKLELGAYAIRLTTLVNPEPPGSCRTDVRLNGVSLRARQDDSREFDLGSNLPGKSLIVAIVCSDTQSVDVKLVFRTEREALLFGDRYSPKGTSPNELFEKRYLFSFAYMPI